MGLTQWISIGTNSIFYWIEIYRILQHTLSFGGLWGGGGGGGGGVVGGWGGGGGGGGGEGKLGLILAEYVPLASHNSYPIIVYSVPSYRLLLSHF